MCHLCVIRRFVFVLVCWYKWSGVGVIYFRCVRAALCAALGCTVNGLPTFVIINNIVCLSLCRCGPSWCLHFDFASTSVVDLFRFAVQSSIVSFMSQEITNRVERIYMSYSYLLNFYPYQFSARPSLEGER